MLTIHNRLIDWNSFPTKIHWDWIRFYATCHIHYFCVLNRQTIAGNKRSIFLFVRWKFFLQIQFSMIKKKIKFLRAPWQMSAFSSSGRPSAFVYVARRCPLSFVCPFLSICCSCPSIFLVHPSGHRTDKNGNFGRFLRPNEASCSCCSALNKNIYV